MSQNWCSLSPDRVVTPSIGIPMEHTYSVVHYLSNKHPQMPVCKIDLKLQLVLWKQLHVPFHEQEVPEEADKKMGEAFNVQKHGKCERKSVCLVRLRFKKHDKWARWNNVCFQTLCRRINKKIDVPTKQCYTVKFCVRFKKLQVEPIMLLKETFQILAISIVET